MIYSESEPKKNWPWLLLISFVLLIIPQLASKPLTKSEAVLGSIAYYFQFSQQYFAPLIQGQKVDAIESFFPSFLMSLFSKDVPVEFLVRLHSCLASFLLSIMTFIVTRLYSKNYLSALIAGLCVFSTLLSERFTAIGDLRMIICLLISYSWFALFHYGFKKRWNKAWLHSLICVSFIFLLGGAFYVFYFYLPLIFVRVKGFKLSNRLLHLRHVLVVSFLITLLLLIWFLFNNFFQSNNFFKINLSEKIAITTGLETDGLFLRYILFPFKAVGAFFPWIIFVWPIFCQSYKRLEKHPTLFTYLRTIAVTIFLFTWLNPTGRISDLLPITLPIAVMTGFHYPIVVSRYFNFFHKLIRFIFAITTFLSFCLLVYYIRGIINESIAIKEILVDLILMSITLLISLRYFIKQIKFSVIWIPFFLAIVLFHWCYNSIADVAFVSKVDYKENALVLTEKIPEDAMVYNFTEKLYIRQMFYLKRLVTKIFPLKEVEHKVVEGDTFESLAFRYYGNIKLAQKLANLNFTNETKMPKIVNITLPKEVYVIFYDTKPINFTVNASDYSWRPISPKVKTNDGKEIRVWFGVKE